MSSSLDKVRRVALQRHDLSVHKFAQGLQQIVKLVFVRDFDLRAVAHLQQRCFGFHPPPIRPPANVRNQEWDEALARDLVGSTLFVGITHVDHKGNLIQKERVFGSVESVGARAGSKLIQTDGVPYVLAPVLDAIEAGDPDFYQLSEAHELVENPEYVMFVTASSSIMHRS